MNYFPLLFCACLLVACNDSRKKSEPEVKTVNMQKQIHEPAGLQARFKDSLIGETYEEYNAVKSALVNSDAQKAQKSAAKLSGILERMEFTDRMGELAQQMSKTADLGNQRKIFQYLTEEMLKLAEANLDSGQLYYQYCPMAFEGEGAYWLSNGKEIRNPYFGDKMLKCGKIERVIE